MLHTPKKTKYRKCHKMPMRSGFCHKACKIRLGDYGLQSTSRGILTEYQIEAGRRAINRQIKQHGKLHVRVLADKPVTKKPKEVKLGKGKGSVEYWSLPVKTGRIIYEIASPNAIHAETCMIALKKGGSKLPFTTRVVKRSDQDEK